MHGAGLPGAAGGRLFLAAWLVERAFGDSPDARVRAFRDEGTRFPAFGDERTRRDTCGRVFNENARAPQLAARAGQRRPVQRQA